MNTHPVTTEHWTPELQDDIVLRSIDDCEMTPDERLQMWASKQLENIAYLHEANPERHQMGIYELADMLSGALAVNCLDWDAAERFELVAAWCPQAELSCEYVTVTRAVTDLLSEQLGELAERLAVNLLQTMQSYDLIEAIDFGGQEL